MGKGVYVASSDYVPRHWATMRAYGPRADVIFGLFVDTGKHGRGQDLVRYRMDAGVDITNEPESWKQDNVNHAICIYKPSNVGLVPIGAIAMK